MISLTAQNMAYARRREHWIFIDSRGAELYEKIHRESNPEFIGVWKHSGASLGDLVELAANHLKNFPFDIAYIVGGINNVTTKDRLTGKISFEWDPPELLISQLIRELAIADSKMAKEFPASKVVFCPIVGSDLSRIVNAHTTTLLQQEVVNETVFAFNEEVFKINKRREKARKRVSMSILMTVSILQTTLKTNGRLSSSKQQASIN